MDEFGKIISKCRENIASCFIDPSHQHEALIDAFIQALKDTDPYTRKAAILALYASQNFYSLNEIATKILPALFPLTIDPDKEVQEECSEVVKRFLKIIEKASQNSELETQGNTEGSRIRGSDKFQNNNNIANPQYCEGEMPQITAQCDIDEEKDDAGMEKFEYSSKAKKSGSEAESDGNLENNRILLPALILPAAGHVHGPRLCDLSLFDCEEQKLAGCHYDFEVAHLSECSDVTLFDYPVSGIITDCGDRFVIPLKVRASAKSKTFIVYFVVDTGAPYTSFTENAFKKISGGHLSLPCVFIQDTNRQCIRSGEYGDKYKNINILGSDFLLKSSISVIVSPYRSTFKNKQLFYLCDFKTLEQAQKLAASPDHPGKKIRQIYSLSKLNLNADSAMEVETAPSTSSANVAQMPSQSGTKFD